MTVVYAFFRCNWFVFRLFIGKNIARHLSPFIPKNRPPENGGGFLVYRLMKYLSLSIAGRQPQTGTYTHICDSVRAGQLRLSIYKLKLPAGGRAWTLLKSRLIFERKKTESAAESPASRERCVRQHECLPNQVQGYQQAAFSTSSHTGLRLPEMLKRSLETSCSVISSVPAERERQESTIRCSQDPERKKRLRFRFTAQRKRGAASGWH